MSCSIEGRAAGNAWPQPLQPNTSSLCPPHPGRTVDQRAERVGRSHARVGIYSLAVDPQRPWLMLTGGTDPLLRLYDRRMLAGAGAAGGAASGGEVAGSRGRAPQWVSAYAPQHLKAALWDSGRHPSLAAPGAAPPPGRHVTAVAFARGGAEVVGSYAGECIYSFDVALHARDAGALLHISESVLRLVWGGWRGGDRGHGWNAGSGHGVGRMAVG